MENNIKVEQWLGNEIKFVEVNGEWMAVAVDVARALGYKAPSTTIRDKVKDHEKMSGRITHASKTRKVTLINNKTIYKLIFRSTLPQAEEFTDWVTDVIETLRESANLTAFELLRKENQKLVTDKLRDGLENAEPKHYRKANTIANKAVSTLYGFDKKLDLGDMPPEMQVDREPIFNDTVELMVLQERMNLDISISKTIYAKHCK